MTPTVRRAGSNAGWLALLGLLCLAASLLLTASPRVANRYTDQGLHEWVSAQPYRVRDVTYVLRATCVATARAGYCPVGPDAATAHRPSQADTTLSMLQGRLGKPLRDRLGDAWYSSQVWGSASGSDISRVSEETNVASFMLALRDQSGARGAVNMVAGQWPTNPVANSGPVDAAVSIGVANAFGLRVGSIVDLSEPVRGRSVEVHIVGIFEPRDRAAAMWVEEPEVLDPYTPLGLDPPEPWRGVLLTDTDGMNRASVTLPFVDFSWRFRVDETALTLADLREVTEAASDARHQSVLDGIQTYTELDTVLVRFMDRVGAARALLAVVQAGVVATLFGLVVLATVASHQRRHGELALLRSRGASLPELARRLLAESALVVAVAVGVGYLASLWVPGRPGGLGWLALVFGAAAALTAPLLAVRDHRRFTVTEDRVDLARPRVSPRRLVAELTLVLVAALGALLLRRRGLGPALPAIDLYLVLVPVLLGAAAAVLTLRVFPYPLRLLAAGAARARGAVSFLGLTRAGRAAPATAGPLAVLVVAVGIGSFCAAVSDSITAARDRVADLSVPGTALVHGGRFPSATADELAASVGVDALAPLVLVDNTQLGAGEGGEGPALAGATAVIVDGPALARVLAASGSTQRLPDELATAARTETPAPAIVSPALAAELEPFAGAGTMLVQGSTLAFTVVGVTETFPGLGTVNARFVVLPWQALPSTQADRLTPTAFAVAGTGLDLADLLRIGDAGQREWVSGVTGEPAGELDTPTAVLTNAQVRDELERGGVDHVLGYTFRVGLGAGLALALLAVGFSVTAGARARGQALSRLRTMGLSTGQGRRLLAYELLPLVALGALVGASVGLVLPTLIGPALGLSAFSDGGDVEFEFDPLLPGLAFALVIVAVVLAMAVQASMNRRARLGVVLRVGGER